MMKSDAALFLCNGISFYVLADNDRDDDHHVHHIPGLPPHLRPHGVPHRVGGPGQDDQ